MTTTLDNLSGPNPMLAPATPSASVAGGRNTTFVRRHRWLT